ncbi:DUF3144 domain-containing protein [Duganella ginsengisoli]|uniref:DUF3144 domain-containing protein n=2 Tax=Pseudoduganella ginsengisoli TaxID=1462440 RepID=A0A6L6PVE6_9BURK|nr:DUF3144 domain-containing protein [Pseudoduganella ginsengisoli]
MPVSPTQGVFIMSTTPTTDEQFMQLVDTFITTANEKAQNMDRNVIGPAMMFAATRFNAYMLAMSTRNVEEFKQQSEPARKYYLEQHEKMMADNFKDFETNFDKYRGN